MSVTLSHQVQGRKLLDNKVAVVYGVNEGGVGSSVAKAFAREGATVYIAARTEAPLDRVAQEITAKGGVAHASKVDVLDLKMVEQHLQEIIKKTGRLDISFNLAGMSYAIGSKLTEITDQRFMDTLGWVRSRFITMTAAARIMERQGSGVILALTAPNARLPRSGMGGFSVGGAAIEAMCRQLALEAGPKGVRVVCLRTGSTPDNPIFQSVFAHLAKVQGTTFEKIAGAEAQVTALKRNPLTTEVANAAVMIASDYGSAITATVVNASAGELVD